MADKKHDQIDWTAIANQPDATKRRVIAASELERVGDDFLITDALSHKNEAGLYVMQVINGNIDGDPVTPLGGAALASEREYWLRIIHDKWGQTVNDDPANVYNDNSGHCLIANLGKDGTPDGTFSIEWLRGQTQRSYTTGRKITIRERRELERRGELRTIQDWGRADVNEHGCIVVKFSDAAMLLDLRGVHYVSKMPITGMQRTQSEPARCKDGVNRTQHFWLYEEVPPWEVAGLLAAKAKAKAREQAGAKDK